MAQMSETTNGQHLRIPTIPAAAFPLLAAETAWFSGPPGWGLLPQYAIVRTEPSAFSATSEGKKMPFVVLWFLANF